MVLEPYTREFDKKILDRFLTKVKLPITVALSLVFKG